MSNQQTILRHTVLHIIAAALLAATYSCAELELCEADHPHMAQIVTQFDWSGISDETIPDSMVVIGIRPMFHSKVASNWCSLPTHDGHCHGRMISPDDTIYYSESQTIGDTIYLGAGDWSFISFTSTQASIQAAQEMATIDDKSTDIFFFSTKALIDINPKYKYWYDRNNYSSWVDVGQNGISYIATRATQIDEHATHDNLYIVDFRPRPIVQTVDIRLHATIIDPEVTVDSIVCAISGIIGGYNVERNTLNVNRTYQGIFETTLTHPATDKITATGTIYPLGLVRNSVKENLQGPGILNVSVFVHFTDDKGQLINRRLDGTINLYRILTDHPSVLYDDNRNVIQTTDHLTLDITSEMEITKKRLSTASDAIDQWLDESTTEEEVE